MKYFLGELIGTFVLSSSLNFMTTYSDGVQIFNLTGVTIGFFIALQISRKLSGAHLNPGVTLMFYFNSKHTGEPGLEVHQCLQMLGGQVLGAFISPLCCWILTANSLLIKPSTEISYADAFLSEVLATSLFYCVILAQSYRSMNLTSNNEVISSAVIALGLAGGISLGGNQSGGGLNPSIALFENLFSYFKTGQSPSLIYLPVYLVCPFIASYVAVIVVSYLSKLEAELKEEIKYSQTIDDNNDIRVIRNAENLMDNK